MMERKTEQILRILNFCVCIFGFLCYLVAFFTTTWNQYPLDGYTVSYGLFFICVSTKTKTDCGLMDMNTLNDKEKASQAFGVLTLVTYFTAAVSCFFLLLFCHVHWKKRLLLFASLVALTTCVFLGICLGMFVGYHSDRSVSYGYGFFLACGSGFMMPVVAVLSFILSRAEVIHRKVLTVRPQPKECRKQVAPICTKLKQTKFHHLSSTLPPDDEHSSLRMETPLPLAADSAENQRRRFQLGLDPMFSYKKVRRLNIDSF